MIFEEKRQQRQNFTKARKLIEAKVGGGHTAKKSSVDDTVDVIL